MGIPCGSARKESACNAGDLGPIPGFGRDPGEGKGYPFQYSGLEKSMDCLAHGVAKSQTGLSNFHFICLTLCNPMDCSPPGSSVHGILLARILEWVAMPSSRGSSQPRDQTHISYVSCIGRPVLYHQCHLGSPSMIISSVITKDKILFIEIG